MIRQFSLRGTPTGFQDGTVELTGVLEYQFDDANEKLLPLNQQGDFIKVRDFRLSREQFLAGNGKLYTFSGESVDISTRRLLEQTVGESRGYRDTVHVEIRLISKYNDSHGMVNSILDTEEIYLPGTRYYEPPLQLPPAFEA